MYQLYFDIVAGPNGAGKSLFSRALTGLDTVIDFDAELKKRRLAFPDISSANLSEAMHEYWLPEQISIAIESESDFGFETNFRDETTMAIVKQFKDAGYITRLFFMGLDSVDTSIKRVMRRVEKGGHDVKNKDIELNYKLSFENLCKYAMSFDKTLIIENSDYSRKITLPKVICKVENGKIIKTSIHISKWAEDIVQRLEMPTFIKKLNLKKEIKRAKRKGRRPGH